ncbi:MAG: DNA primase [Planctomycetes bacterium]|nr:DNA primase [Planctomycetota bacterium]
MARFSSDDVVEQVRNATDLVRLISEYVPLQRSGSRFKALCPFHEEKTPSFVVTPQKQIWKCFGCGEGGDCFSFVMKQERVGFREALQMLAERAGVEMKRASKDAARPDEKKAIYDANRWAAGLYHRYLLDGEGAKEARVYLASRGISAEMIDKFNLGCAPPGWDGLLGEAKKKGIAVGDLDRAGLVIRRTGQEGCYDRFRGRLMFPIADVQGRVIGFGGRVLDDSTPKYVNSPETVVFSKSRTLYGLDLAKKAILDRRRVAIFEGYTDVIMAHQYGADWTVAVLGTALTRDHVKTLRRFADEVVLVFDTDTAGQKASDRSLDVFLQEEADVKVAMLPAGKDPCDFILEQGAEAFVAVLDGAKDLIRYKLDMAFPDGRELRPAEKSRAIDEILSTIVQCPNPTLVALLRKEVSGRTGVPEQDLQGRMNSLKRTAFSQTETNETASKVEEETAEAKAERQVIESLLAENELIREMDREDMIGLLKDSALRSAAEVLVEMYDASGSVGEAELLGNVDVAARPVIEAIIGGQREGLDYRAQLNGALQFLKKERLKQERDGAKAEMLNARKAGDEAEYKRWLDRYSKAMMDLAAL